MCAGFIGLTKSVGFMIPWMREGALNIAFTRADVLLSISICLSSVVTAAFWTRPRPKLHPKRDESFTSNLLLMILVVIIMIIVVVVVVVLMTMIHLKMNLINFTSSSLDPLICDVIGMLTRGWCTNNLWVGSLVWAPERGTNRNFFTFLSLRCTSWFIQIFYELNYIINCNIFHMDQLRRRWI